MQTIVRALAAIGLIAGCATTSAVAQERPAAAPLAQPLPTCQANGYAKPYYGGFGDNDGVARAYELASPCNGPEVRDAAVAIGMGRFKPLGIKNISTLRFQAKGKIANEQGVLETADKVDLALNFTLPAARLAVTKTVGKAKATDIRVFNDKAAWNETDFGVGGSAAQAGALAARAPLVKLNPYGALLSVIEAEGHAVVSKDAQGRTVVTGASPYDSYKVAVTLDAKSRPVAARLEAEGHVYTATFDTYSDKWESPYLYVFPSHMAWTLDSKPYADLTVTAFHSNPYVVFPQPKP